MRTIISAIRPRQVLVAVIATLCAMGATASASRAASPLNVIATMTNSVAPGSAPVNSLPSTAVDDPSNGTSYAAPTSTATDPPAGGDDDYSQSYTFDYGSGGGQTTSSDGGSDQTVQTLDIDLPTSVLASLAAVKDFCTPAELGTMPTATEGGTGWLAAGGTGCPADSQIGELSGDVNALGLALPISGNLYLERAPSSSDVAGVAVEVETSLGVNSYRAQVASGAISFVTNSSDQPSLQVALTLPGIATLSSYDSGAAAGETVPYVLQDLTQTISGLTPGGAPFNHMPTSDATATGTTSATVQYNGADDGDGNPTTTGATVTGVSGSQSVSITPTGAGSLAFGPQLSADVVRDSADYDVGLTTTITQAADEAASRQIVLTLPPSLQPNLANSLNVLCAAPNATASNCTPIGTVSAVSPLLPGSENGTVYLTASSTGPSLTVSLPEPTPFVLTGAVDLATGTVTFPEVPDLPLSSLAVDIDGGANGIYETTCTSTSNTGVVSGAFTGQNGATDSSTASFSVSGCPAETTANAAASAPPAMRFGAPRVVAHGRHLTAHSGRLTIQVRATSTSAAFQTVTVTAPRGVRFVPREARYAVTAIGRKLTSAAVSHGRLHLGFATPGRSLFITVHRAGFALEPSLARSIAAHRTKSLHLGLGFTTTGQSTLDVIAAAAL